MLLHFRKGKNDPNCLKGKFAKLCYRHVEKFQQGEPLDSLLSEAIHSEYSIESSFFDE
jgi:hypothetical protein